MQSVSECFKDVRRAIRREHRWASVVKLGISLIVPSQWWEGGEGIIIYIIITW